MLERKTAEEIVDRIRALTAPTRIILFGSRARGGADEDSDIDILVVVEEAASRRKLAIEIQRALTGLGTPVDVIVATEEIMARYGDIPGVIYEEAVSGGVELYAG
ncbi:MAG: nucleotidyltransferase domain-containing protein [Candidatus Zixiibacteriota bacterium]|jgi:predicted nucleotidyltransferase